MLKVESYKKGIVLSTGFNILNKGLVFLNGLMVAYFFGVTHSTDFFFYIYNSVAILGVFFTAMNSSVIIPESMRIRSTEGNDKAVEFLNFFILLYGGFMLIALSLVLIDPISFFSTVSNFKRGQLLDNRALLYLSLPLFGLIFLINLLIDILSSYKFFTISMIVGIVNGIFSILFIVLFHKGAGIQSVFYGMLLAYFLNLGLLTFLMIKYLNWKFHFKKPLRSKRIWSNLGFAQLGNLASSLSLYAPIYILSGFSAGIITALSFAQQISSLPATLIIYQFSSVVGIKFNELYAEKKYKEINTIFLSTANFLIFIVLPISGLCFLFSDQIIIILLKRGKFDETGIAYASLFLKYLVLLLPFIVINTLFARLFMASHKIKEAFWYQTISNVLLIGAMYFSIHKFGIIGYPASILGMYLLNTIFCYFLEKKYFKIINYKKVLVNLSVFSAINLIIATLIYLLMRRLAINSELGILIIGSVAYLAMLATVAFKFNLNETLNALMKQFLQKTRFQ
ncbi:MAG: polysaccharide biosynthesis C-terminal domain-containing protein [Chitinophagaceae bacterium]|nr:polysaccharide biosynthesis C-terminal domain-containing protein [Chitinophagaceae bacterium]